MYMQRWLGANAALALLALATQSGAQTARTGAVILPAVPGGAFTGAFGQPIRAMGNPYAPFLGAGPLGGLSNGVGPLGRGTQFIGPLSGLSGGQPILATGQGPFASPLGGQNLLSNQPIFNGASTQNPTVPTVTSPLVLSAGGPGFGYSPAIGFGGPTYPGYGYYGPQSAYYSGGVPGMSGGATVNTAASGSGLTGSQPIARTSDWIDAKLTASNRIEISWRGDPQAVSSITFVLLDRNRRPIKRQVVSHLPARAALTLTSKTAYYQVIVQYVNATTTSVISPL